MRPTAKPLRGRVARVNYRCSLASARYSIAGLPTTAGIVSARLSRAAAVAGHTVERRSPIRRLHPQETVTWTGTSPPARRQPSLRIGRPQFASGTSLVARRSPRAGVSVMLAATAAAIQHVDD